MKDKDFKRLEHKYKNYRKYSDGKEIAYGYRDVYKRQASLSSVKRLP